MFQLKKRQKENYMAYWETASSWLAYSSFGWLIQHSAILAISFLTNLNNAISCSFLDSMDASITLLK